MNNVKEYKGLLAFHPGSYIEKIVEDLNITQEEFVMRLGTTPKTISKIINGEAPLSNETSFKLYKLTGISVKTWMNLQNEYDRKILEIKDLINDWEKICDLIDFPYFTKNNFIAKGKYSLKEKINKLRVLFNISNLTYLEDFNCSVSYRNTKEFSKKSIVNSNIMLELATNEARHKAERKLIKKN